MANKKPKKETNKVNETAEIKDVSKADPEKEIASDLIDEPIEKAPEKKLDFIEGKTTALIDFDVNNLNSDILEKTENQPDSIDKANEEKNAEIQDNIADNTVNPIENKTDEIKENTEIKENKEEEIKDENLVSIDDKIINEAIDKTIAEIDVKEDEEAKAEIKDLSISESFEDKIQDLKDTSDEIKTEEIKSEEINPEQSKLDEAKIDDLKTEETVETSSSEINNAEIKTEEIKAENVTSEEKSEENKSEEIKSEEVKTEEIKSDVTSNADAKTSTEIKETENKANEVTGGTPNEPVKKVKKPLSKVAKLSIVIGSVAFLIACAILIPIIIMNFKYIYVKEAIDFTEPEKGNIYVIKNDVTSDSDITIKNPYSINLKGHKVTVNGKFEYNVTDTATIRFGTIEKKIFVNKGSISATDFIINAPNCDIIINSDIKATNINITAKTVIISANLDATSVVINSDIITIDNCKITANYDNGSVNLNADDIKLIDNKSEINTLSLNLHALSGLVIGGKINAVNSFVIDAAYLEINSNAIIDTADFRINNVNNFGDKISYIDTRAGFITFNNSVITLKSKAVINDLTLTNNNTIDIYCNVNAIYGINNELNDNVNNVRLFNNINVTLIKNIDVVNYREGVTITTLDNCGAIKKFVVLDKPAEMSINIRDGEYFLTVSGVLNADVYVYYLDGKELVITDAVEIKLDSPDFLKPGTHVLRVIARSNNAADETVVYEDSQANEISYGMTFKLATPNASINEDTLMITIPLIDYADAYIVNINGTEHKVDADKLNNSQDIDISNWIVYGQNNVIKITATNNNSESFLNSDTKILYYFGVVKLEKPVANVELIYTPDSVKLSWAVVNNAKYYAVYKKGTTKPIIETLANEYTFDMNSIEDGDTFIVKALKNNYYSASDNSDEVTYNKIVLSSPVINGGISSLDRKINFNSVTNSAYYNVLVNNVVIGRIDSVENTTNYDFIIPSANIAAGDKVSVKAMNDSLHYNLDSSASTEIIYKIKLDKVTSINYGENTEKTGINVTWQQNSIDGVSYNVIINGAAPISVNTNSLLILYSNLANANTIEIIAKSDSTKYINSDSASIAFNKVLLNQVTGLMLDNNKKLTWTYESAILANVTNFKVTVTEINNAVNTIEWTHSNKELLEIDDLFTTISFSIENGKSYTISVTAVADTSTKYFDSVAASIQYDCVIS